jgi:hypothetical protein
VRYHHDDAIDAWESYCREYRANEYLKRHQRARARRVNLFCIAVTLIGAASIIAQVWP